MTLVTLGNLVTLGAPGTFVTLVSLGALVARLDSTAFSEIELLIYPLIYCKHVMLLSNFDTTKYVNLQS